MEYHTGTNGNRGILTSRISPFRPSSYQGGRQLPFHITHQWKSIAPGSPPGRQLSNQLKPQFPARLKSQSQALLIHFPQFGRSYTHISL